MKQLKTRWADQVDKEHVLEEYPRPMLRRDSYVNLNGLWDYVITIEKGRPKNYDGKILVPFSPEAFLSGVNRQLQPTETMWYHREIPDVVKPADGMRWMLHFGAVDQYAVVYVNGKKISRHLGGYLPFSVDVTDALREGKNELMVQVRDYSDTFYYARGKQKLRRGGMFYSAQSGIWQTVWMERVPDVYITDIVTVPLYDEKAFRIKVLVSDDDTVRPVKVAVAVSSDEMEPVWVKGNAKEELLIPLERMHAWSPEDPFLYNIRVCAGEDFAGSYAAMRKIHVEKDKEGISRMYLNNRPYFQRGVLDQGYWPEGLYTPPCDEAMVHDIRVMKALGFNMLRKHLKVEPQRWYYHCDRLGMLVWQDMVNGGRSYRSWYVTYLATAMEYFHIRMPDSMLWLLGRQDERGRKQFISEMKETIRRLYNHPSIVTWVIFNEGWGQFYAGEVTKIARKADDTRLIDQASGWFDQGGGDMRSIHNYFFPLEITPQDRVTVLSEYGGYSLSVPEHRMYKKIYGYRIYRKRDELTKGYRELIEESVLPNIEKGLSAVIYTQLSDVEEEVNGIMTYDRKFLKLDADTVKNLNKKQMLTDI